jgi:His-Xaa-Ser system protein HxsD
VAFSNPLAAPAPAVATSRTVSDLQTTVSADRVELDLAAAAFPRDAVYAAAFAFIDRGYVRLDRLGSERISIVLRARAGAPIDAAALAADLQNELLAQAWRQRLADDGRELTASIAAGAFGVAAQAESAPIDDLLSDGAADAFDDPLGIAMSWEDKYAKKAGHDGAASGPQPTAGDSVPEPTVKGEQGT